MVCQNYFIVHTYAHYFFVLHQKQNYSKPNLVFLQLSTQDMDISMKKKHY